MVTQHATREMERLRSENERAMKREMQRRKREQMMAPRTPPPVEGRAHSEVQTETFLEELTDRPVEVDADTQTEAFQDRPPSPLFVPAKSGVDKETQVDPKLVFNFDVEVKPILEVLVGKTLQVSMLEVMEEEELAAIRKRQDEFEQMRNAELMEVQRLEAEATRRFSEKQRRVKQAWPFSVLCTEHLVFLTPSYTWSYPFMCPPLVLTLPSVSTGEGTETPAEAASGEGGGAVLREELPLGASLQRLHEPRGDRALLRPHSQRGPGRLPSLAHGLGGLRGQLGVHCTLSYGRPHQGRPRARHRDSGLSPACLPACLPLLVQYLPTRLGHSHLCITTRTNRSASTRRSRSGWRKRQRESKRRRRSAKS